MCFRENTCCLLGLSLSSNAWIVWPPGEGARRFFPHSRYFWPALFAPGGMRYCFRENKKCCCSRSHSISSTSVVDCFRENNDQRHSRVGSIDNVLNRCYTAA